MEQYYPRIKHVVDVSGGNANSAIFAVRASCSLPYEFSHFYGRAGCKRLVENAIAYAKRGDVDTVVISSAWPMYFMRARNGEWSLNAAALPSLERFKRTIAELRKRHKRVYLVLTQPLDFGGALDPRARIRRTVWSPGFRLVDVKQPSKIDLQKWCTEIQMLLRKIASDTGALIIDPAEALCGVATCSPVTTDGEPIYHDYGHLRPSFVRDHASFMDESVFQSSPATSVNTESSATKATELK